MTKIIFLCFLVLGTGIWIFLKLILTANIIEQKYTAVLYVLPIILLSQIVASLVPMLTNYLIYFEKTYIASFTGLIICALNILLSLMLIPVYGVYGAATVSLFSNIAYFVLYIFVIRHLSKKKLQLFSSNKSNETP